MKIIAGNSNRRFPEEIAKYLVYSAIASFGALPI